MNENDILTPSHSTKLINSGNNIFSVHNNNIMTNNMINNMTNNMTRDTNEIEQVCTNRDEKYASMALNVAHNSNMKYHQHGCIAVADGAILARGWNSYGSSSSSKDKYLRNTCSCHAEVDVLRKIKRLLIKKQLHNTNRRNRRNMRLRFLSRISIYVVRKDKCGNQYKDSTPCANCVNCMKMLNIKNVIYSNASGRLTKCRVCDYTTTYSSSGTIFMNNIYT
jgi:tRNA(Arg) A34 adenosine deaminase TadA